MQKDLSPETMLSSQKHSSLEDLFYHFLLAPTHICPEKSYNNKAHNTLAFSFAIDYSEPKSLDLNNLNLACKMF